MNALTFKSTTRSENIIIYNRKLNKDLVNAPIRDYYITGSLHSAVLIDRNGEVEWLCFPSFNSPSIFAAMPDEQGGRFKIEMPGYTAESD